MAGAPTSYGYPGSVNSAVLADWLTRAASARFSVAGEDDWKVTVQAGLDRGIRINAGTGIGDGVMDVFPDYDTRSLPLVASGARYFLIVARRNWSTPASTNFVVIPGTSARALPTRLDSPGQESDQPIALVRVQAGNTVVQEIVDLRAWAGNGGVEAVDVMGREPLARPGAAVKIGTSVHRYEYDPANGGSFAWRSYPLVDVDTGWANLPSLPGEFKPYGSQTAPLSGWTGVQFRIVNGWAMINGAVSHPTNWGANAVVAVIPASQGPSTQIQGTNCVIRKSSGTAGTWDVAINAGTGAYSFSAMWPVG